MMLFKYYLRTLFTNRPLWAWGVGFTVFWLFMGAFVFGFNMTAKQVNSIFDEVI
jgi:hypothetical protein